MAQQHQFSRFMTVSDQSQPGSNRDAMPLFAYRNDSEARLARLSLVPDVRGRGHDGPGNTEEECTSKIGELDEVIDAIVTDANSRVLSNAEKREYLRKRNALYSQRKYYRKKLKKHQLTAEKASLEQKNVHIKIENALLENAIAWANKQVELHENEASTSVCSSAKSYSLLTCDQSYKPSSSSIDQLLKSALLRGALLEQTAETHRTHSSPLLRSLTSNQGNFSGLVRQQESTLSSAKLLSIVRPTNHATLLDLLLQLAREDTATDLAHSVIAQQQGGLGLPANPSRASAGMLELIQSLESRFAPAALLSSTRDLPHLARLLGSQQQQLEDLISLQALLQQQAEVRRLPSRPGLLASLFDNDARVPSSGILDRQSGNMLPSLLSSPSMATTTTSLPSSSSQPLLSAADALLPAAPPSLTQSLAQILLELQRVPPQLALHM